MNQMQRKSLFAALAMAGVMLLTGATTGAASRVHSVSVPDGRDAQTLNVSRVAANEITALLSRNQFSKETAGLLVQMVLSHDGTAFAGKRRSSGGWCWNEDGTFYGSLPCPKEIANRDRTSAGKSKAAIQPGAHPLVLAKGRVSRAVATDIDALLDGRRLSKETAGIFILVVLNGRGENFPGYHKGGGWCWNDDGSFKGSLPCPK